MKFHLESIKKKVFYAYLHMLTVTPVEPLTINPFTLANDPNTSHWHSLILKFIKAKRILVVTGAGISVEAGIPVRI